MRGTRVHLPLYQIDAFTDRPFAGNPAAVCPLEAWLDDGLLQAIAAENNLSETAFFVAEGDAYRLRWFSPVREVDMCGHATLASAFVLFNDLGYDADQIRFLTRGGELRVTREGVRLRMDFPLRTPRACPAPEALLQGLQLAPRVVLAADDYLAVFDDEAQIRALEPDQNALAKLDLRGVIATAPGRDVDFVSRFFAPNYGIPEDPVTGSAHCTLTPYWAERLGKTKLTARQLSARGGSLDCELIADRVLLSGTAVKVLQGELELPDPP